MKRLSKDDLKLRDELVQKLNDAKAGIETAYGEVNALLTGKVAEAVGKYNDVLTEVESFRDDLVGRMEEYEGERSDKWRESDAGSNYESWKADWENLAVDEVEVPVELDIPEVEHGDELDGLDVEVQG